MKKAYKLIATFLCVAMILCIAPVSAFAATNPTNLTGFASPVGSIQVSGVSVVSAPAPTVTSTTFRGYTNYTYTYNIVLAAGTTTNPTVTFTKAANADPDCKILPLPPAAPQVQVGGGSEVLTYTPDLINGTASFYTIVHHDAMNEYGRADSYYFNFSLSTGASADQVTVGNVTMQFGDPDYEPAWPESFMKLNSSNGQYDAVYTGSDAIYYYPGTLSFYADCGNTELTLKGDGVQFVTFGGGVRMHDSITTGANGSDLFTLRINRAGKVTITGGSQQIVVNFSAPKNEYPASDGTPTDLNGYLPISQFATGSEWGNATNKVVGGYSTTGISLGAAGGFVEFDMSVVNSDTTPYGVDFVVYGNAFDGNPEAASVMVYGIPNGSDTAGWYELAGSLYYAEETLRNVDVTYKKESSDIKYKVTRGTTVLCDWTTFTGATTWWPETTEGYNSTWGLGDNSMVTYNSGANEITYHGVTLIRDTDTTADYAFGYADVTPNGDNITYGAATNPYATNTSGGNSFDISWAVDVNGNPVKLASISKIRVYTSAVLNISSSTPVFTVPGIFGETSAEVCGISAVSGGGGGSQSSTPTIQFGKSTDSMSNVVTAHMGHASVSFNRGNTCYIKVQSSADYIFVNGQKVASGALIELTVATGSTVPVQIITQDGSEAPYVTVVNVSR